MAWMWADLNHSFRDDKGWQKAKGLMNKILIGETGISKAIKGINDEWKNVKTSVFNCYLVSKKPKEDLATSIKEHNKLLAIAPKVKALGELAKNVKAKYANKLPSAGAAFLDKLQTDCAKMEQMVKDHIKFEQGEYKKNHNI